MQATKHPSFLRAKQRAAQLGSKAKSVDGVTKFLKEHLRTERHSTANQWLPRPHRTFLGTINEWQPHNHAYRAKSWRETVAERQSDPEFKRALRDREFGLKFTGQLLREVKKDYRKILAGDPSSANTFVDGLEGRLDRINQIRTAHSLKPTRFAHQLAEVRVMYDTAESVGVRVVKRGKDWEVVPTYGYNHFEHEDGSTYWKNGVPKEYTRATNTTYVRSFAGLRSPQEIVYFLSAKVYNITLPEGYYWDIDQDGLRAVKANSTKDDFHPLADYLIGENAAQDVISKLEYNRALRLETAAKEAAALAEMEGVWVCVADSRRAGNCVAGTLSFARRHALDPARHYAATELVRIANGDAGRVRLAITAAVHRHHKDLERGYSILEQHK